jgi:hypothetical protein
MATSHPDDEFHPPTSDDPHWTETCWFTFNCLTEWRFDGVTAWGEDHDNWSVAAGRQFFRNFLCGAAERR